MEVPTHPRGGLPSTEETRRNKGAWKLSAASPNTSLRRASGARVSRNHRGGTNGAKHGGLGIILSSGGTEFGIYPNPSAGQTEHTLAEWVVDDLDAEMTRLPQHGVTIENYDLPGLKTVNGVAHLGPVKVSWIRDSEGNILSLGQWLEQSAP